MQAMLPTPTHPLSAHVSWGIVLGPQNTRDNRSSGMTLSACLHSQHSRLMGGCDFEHAASCGPRLLVHTVRRDSNPVARGVDPHKGGLYAPRLAGLCDVTLVQEHEPLGTLGSQEECAAACHVRQCHVGDVCVEWRRWWRRRRGAHCHAVAFRFGVRVAVTWFHARRRTWAGHGQETPMRSPLTHPCAHSCWPG